MLFGTSHRPLWGSILRLVRIAVASLAAVSAAVFLAPPVGAAAPAALHVLPGSTLAVQGTGFVPNTVVRLRVTRSGTVLRVVLVRAGVRGGFTAKLPSAPGCGVTVVSATGALDRRARVATGLERRCPPPPPIRAPGAG